MKLGYVMLIDLRSYTECPSYYTAEYGDPVAFQIALTIIGAIKDAVALNVGANVGFWAVPLDQAIRPPGVLLAYEPQLGNFGRLGENIRLNTLSDFVGLLNYGLCDSGAVLSLSLRGDLVAGSSTGTRRLLKMIVPGLRSSESTFFRWTQCFQLR